MMRAFGLAAGPTSSSWPDGLERARDIVRRSDATTPSAALLRVEAEIRHGTASAARLARLIEASPELAARVLRVANSGFYAPVQSVSTLPRAIAILGDALLRQLALASIALARRARNQSIQQSVVAARFSGDAVRAAVICRELARLTHRDQEAAFAAGLLHDLGRLYLLDQGRDAYAALALARRMEPTADDERRVCGATHEEVGAILVANWSLPEPIGEVLRAHHAPRPGSLAELVGIADGLVAPLSRPAPIDTRMDDGPASSLAMLGIEHSAWADGLPAVRDQIAELLQAFD